MNNEIVIYQSEILSSPIEVRIEEETVWLTQLQMLELFESTKQNVSLHINNIFKEGELDKYSTVKEYLTVQQEGIRSVKRRVKIYNLDVIISVGYRVKSQRGTQFRIWASKILKEYLLKGYALNHRMEVLEKKVNSIEIKNNEFDLILNTTLLPNQGIFYDGQIFDAHSFVSKLIKSAKKSIELLDNYIDESVLTLLSKRDKDVRVTIYTKSISKQLKLDLERFNTQYEPVEVKEFAKSHDRFLIIDEIEVYHIGASLKDLGKKWFAFSKLNIDALELLGKL
jgi:Virulence protein RhuM family